MVTRAGIALTGVGSSTIAATRGSEALMGLPLDAAGINRAADMAAEAAQPRSDHRGSAEYKRHVVHTFVTRILTRIADTSERAA
jgi:carbon-monoxide dehydrogenase medium subunit